MGLNFHTNHNLLVATVGLSFLALSTIIAIIPAYQVQENNPELPASIKPSDAELRGKMIYVSEGCQACHTQQVRSNVMDETWGNRPSVPGDYAQNKRLSFFQNTASLLGSERTGPDLTNIGVRQPGDLWHLIHLYNPRSVVPESIMPSYPWLFREIKELRPGDNEVKMPSGYGPSNGNKVVTTQRVEDLIAYLQSLKQTELPKYINTEFEGYEWQKSKKRSISTSVEEALIAVDGEKLYLGNCKVCHQDNGEGIQGAFPSLKGSEIINNENPTEMISIVLYGLDRKNEYGAMLAFEQTLSDEEIAAILTYERNNWGNSAPEVTAEQVKEVRGNGKPLNWPAQ